MEWWNAVLPVVTLALGYVGTIWTEARRDTRASAEASAARRLERNTRLADERRVFELETLRGAATAIGHLARASGKAHHFDLMAAKRDGTDRYVNYQMPEELSEELFYWNREVARLGAELMDESTRQRVEEVREAIGILGLGTEMTVGEAEQEMLRIGHLLDAAQQSVATRIRGIYDGSVDLRPPTSN